MAKRRATTSNDIKSYKYKSFNDELLSLTNTIYMCAYIISRWVDGLRPHGAAKKEVIDHVPTMPNDPYRCASCHVLLYQDCLFDD